MLQRCSWSTRKAAKCHVYQQAADSARIWTCRIPSQIHFRVFLKPWGHLTDKNLGFYFFSQPHWALSPVMPYGPTSSCSSCLKTLLHYLILWIAKSHLAPSVNSRHSVWAAQASRGKGSVQQLLCKAATEARQKAGMLHARPPAPHKPLVTLLLLQLRKTFLLSFNLVKGSAENERDAGAWEGKPRESE